MIIDAREGTGGSTNWNLEWTVCRFRTAGPQAALAEVYRSRSQIRSYIFEIVCAPITAPLGGFGAIDGVLLPEWDWERFRTRCLVCVERFLFILFY